MHFQSLNKILQKEFKKIYIKYNLNYYLEEMLHTRIVIKMKPTIVIVIAKNTSLI